jgi:hypothetical protein
VRLRPLLGRSGVLRTRAYGMAGAPFARDLSARPQGLRSRRQPLQCARTQWF